MIDRELGFHQQDTRLEAAEAAEVVESDDSQRRIEEKERTLLEMKDLYYSEKANLFASVMSSSLLDEDGKEIFFSLYANENWASLECAFTGSDDKDLAQKCSQLDRIQTNILEFEYRDEVEEYLVTADKVLLAASVLANNKGYSAIKCVLYGDNIDSENLPDVSDCIEYIQSRSRSTVDSEFDPESISILGLIQDLEKIRKAYGAWSEYKKIYRDGDRTDYDELYSNTFVVENVLRGNSSSSFSEEGVIMMYEEVQRKKEYLMDIGILAREEEAWKRHQETIESIDSEVIVEALEFEGLEVPDGAMEIISEQEIREWMKQFFAPEILQLLSHPNSRIIFHQTDGVSMGCINDEKYEGGRCISAELHIYLPTYLEGESVSEKEKRIHKNMLFGTIIHESAHILHSVMDVETLNAWHESSQDPSEKRFSTFYTASSYAESSSKGLREEWCEGWMMMLQNPALYNSYAERQYAVFWECMSRYLSTNQIQYVNEYMVDLRLKGVEKLSSLREMGANAFAEYIDDQASSEREPL